VVLPRPPLTMPDRWRRPRPAARASPSRRSPPAASPAGPRSSPAPAPASGATALRLAREGARVLGPIMQSTIPSVATAERLAATICWLLSDDASNVNGAILPPTAAGRPS